MSTDNVVRTQQQFRSLEFWVPPGGSSMTPKAAFDLRDSGELETLYDIAHYRDRWRFADAIGNNASTLLVNKILSNKPIPVYRTAIAGRIILPGSYVTEKKSYAIQHGKDNIRIGKPVLYTLAVRPSELVTLGDPHEFLYVPEYVGEAFNRFQKQMRI